MKEMIRKIPFNSKAAIDSGVAREPIEDWDRYVEILDSRIGNDTKLMRLIHRRAKSRIKRLIFGESDQLDVLKAAQICKEDGNLEYKKIIGKIYLKSKKKI